MQTFSPVRVAVIGVGGVSKAHIAAIRNNPDQSELVAICDPNEQALARMRTDWPEVVAYDDVNKLVDDTRFDAAIVATPHYLHFEHAAAVARTGRPVLVEKPAVISTTEARELDRIAAEEHTTVVAGQTLRHGQDTEQIRRLLADATQFGALKSFTLESWQDLTSYTTGTQGASHWLFDGALAGGGAAFSIGCHLLDLTRYFTGSDFCEVFAFADSEPPFINQAESRIHATLRTDTGALGSFSSNYLASRIPYSETMLLIGEHGSLVQHVDVLGEYSGPYSFASSYGKAPETFAEQFSGWRQLTPPGDISVFRVANFERQMLDFVKVVRREKESASTIRDNFNTIACLEALIRSSREGRPTEVERW